MKDLVSRVAQLKVMQEVKKLKENEVQLKSTFGTNNIGKNIYETISAQMYFKCVK